LAAVGAVIEWNAETSSHEFTARVRGVEVDIHWNLLRPARLREDVSDDLLARRVYVNGIWALDPSDAAFCMLVHPAFTKYVCGRAAKLVRVLDFARASQSGEVDWRRVVALCHRCGVRGAAWATLTWLRLTLPTITVPRYVDEELAPGRIRQHYLRAWIALNLPSRLHGVPAATAFAFTLPMHDSWSDAWRALSGIVRERRSSPRRGSHIGSRP